MLTLDQYTRLLRKHDWSHEFSDDQRVWRAGREELGKLREFQMYHDSDFKVWNAHCPAACKDGRAFR